MRRGSIYSLSKVDSGSIAEQSAVIICTGYIRCSHTFLSQDTWARIANYCDTLIKIKLIYKQHGPVHINISDLKFTDLIMHLE
jgi:hypothetical protein